MLRTGLRTVLGRESDLAIVGEASDGLEVVALARRLLPDVVLTDVRLPGQDGLAATRAIVAADLRVRVLVHAVPERTSDDEVAAALRAGASGFLSKGVATDDLVAAIRAVAAGTAVLTPPLLRRLLDRVGSPPVPPDEVAEPGAPDGLTARELEVLAHVARGLSNGEIASELTVSETTVKTHVGNVLTKLGLRDRVQAVVYAYETGLVKPRP